MRLEERCPLLWADAPVFARSSRSEQSVGYLHVAACLAVPQRALFAPSHLLPLHAQDLLWDHENAIVIPHLGASTEEAEDAAAAMAAETIMRFLTTGEIVNSVNFPTTLLEKHCTTTSVRIAIVNQNVAGSLAQILAIFGDKNLNILQQVNKSRGDVAYNVVDVELVDGIDWAEVQKALTTVPEVISSRFIVGDTSLGGFGYAVNDPEHGYSV
jgi:D-3-phosphoglycerate dehydrogenase / 2-oxoglutarate reductase